MPAVQTANKKFRTDDASHLNSERKILDGWCQPFKRLKKNFERMMPAVRTVNENFFEGTMQAIRTAYEKFWAGAVRRSNC